MCLRATVPPHCTHGRLALRWKVWTGHHAVEPVSAADKGACARAVPTKEHCGHHQSRPHVVLCRLSGICHPQLARPRFVFECEVSEDGEHSAGLSCVAACSSNRCCRSKTAASLACNPFALPGFISQLPSGLSTFRTFDQSCPVPGLLPTLLSLLPTSPYHALAVAPTDSHSRSDVTDRIANKTVLMIGDTVDEALVNHFCTLIGRTTEVVDQRHPWGVAWTLVPEAHRTSSSNNIISSDPGDKALAHYCYMPEYDFLLTSVYHLGTDVDDTFRKSPGFTAPTLFELRVEDIYSRYMKDLASAHPAAPSIPPSRRHSYPDLTILSSTFWDLARFAQEDSLQMRSLVEDVSEHRLLMWRGRSVDMLHSIQSAWKDTKLGWRSLHAPGDTEKATLEWYTGTQEEGSNVSACRSFCVGTDEKRRGVHYPSMSIASSRGWDGARLDEANGGGRCT